MFQRLKGAIDSTIAAEQARQRGTPQSPSRSNSGAKRPTSRTASPSKRPSRTQDRSRKDGDPLQKGPDPAEFEPEFVIGDEDAPNRVGTPRPAQERNSDGVAGEPSKEQPAAIDNGGQAVEKRTEDGTDGAQPDLPTDVRVRLRKLEKLESRYQELLRSYRIAHARVSTIEPFETSLRENTPLTSINDPGALVEYLNQLNLKGDMVLDELKRVSSERDSVKQKLKDAEKSAREAWDEVAKVRAEKTTNGVEDALPDNAKAAVTQAMSEDDTVASESSEIQSPAAAMKSQSVSSKPRTSSIPSILLFSPKSKAMEKAVGEEETEEIFSYDNEMPRLENELKERQNEVAELKTEVASLKCDLAIARESTQSMVQTLEDATRESNMFRDQKDRYEADLTEQKSSSENTISSLKSNLDAAGEKLRHLETQHDTKHTARIAELEERLQQASKELEGQQEKHKEASIAAVETERLQAEVLGLQAELSEMQTIREQQEKRIDTFSRLVTNLREQLSVAEGDKQRLTTELDSKTTAAGSPLLQIPHTDQKGPDTEKSATSTSNAASNGDDPSLDLATDIATSTMTGTMTKKKNKKKKKGGKLATELEIERPVESPATQEGAPMATNGTYPLERSENTVLKLQEELSHLRTLLEEKDAAIERLHGKLKNEEDLREEIDSLRDDLVNLGQEHVEAKDRVKELLAEKSALENTVAKIEKELTDLQSAHVSSTADSEQAKNDLTAQFADLKSKATTLQTDLSVAQQLASSRFKDLTDLRAVLQKAQPELIELRSEVTELKSVKDELITKSADLQRLEARHEAVRSELAGFRKLVVDSESEIKTLNQKITQETSNRLKAEENSKKASQELQRVEDDSHQLKEKLDRMSKDLANSRDELNTSRARVREIEQQIAHLNRDIENLKEEIELKTAQYASAQSLMSSMRDQTTEMATQTKETRERCESLEEEVADAHRLLGERSREGETMRRLLAEVEGRSDSRIREMKERMDAAIEERDRAEDEASTAGRRRARELEELRNKVREVERSLKRAEEDKEELESAQRDWKRRREELDQKSEQSTRETEEVRKAMSELRDALDESEKHARDLEGQKTELRRSVEETQHRLDRLQKSNKTMADEIRSMQTAKTKAMDVEAPSSRSSLDSTPSRVRLNSPAPKSRTSSGALIDGASGQNLSSIDYVYLKNILLQFLEQKDKKLQRQLIPVLGMLLHFDRKDEQKWMAAITTK